VFELKADDQRRSRDDEIWLRSPFTREQRASMHVSLSANVYKDFSSGKGGGIIQFCREMLHQQGRRMSMFEAAEWMLSQGICTGMPRSAPGPEPERQPGPVSRPRSAASANPAIEVDLRRHLRCDHPEWMRRGISAATCRYLGCGFLPPRADGASGSPLHSRLVFQIRGVQEHGRDLQPIILSHTGRALQPEQENSDGKYWSYPFRKGLEIYNQDQLLLDPQAVPRIKAFGLVLVEGFFDVAKLVEAGCRKCRRADGGPHQRRADPPLGVDAVSDRFLPHRIVSGPGRARSQGNSSRVRAAEPARLRGRRLRLGPQPNPGCRPGPGRPVGATTSALGRARPVQNNRMNQKKKEPH
jgi:hypothetical protein